MAYDVMGHTFFFEDGVETGSTLDGNLGMLTRVSNALLNTDTTPSTFWVRPEGFRAVVWRMCVPSKALIALTEKLPPLFSSRTHIHTPQITNPNNTISNNRAAGEISERVCLGG